MSSQKTKNIRNEQQRCLGIVRKHRTELTHKLLHNDLGSKQKEYLGRVLRLLRDIEYEIQELKRDSDPVVTSGDFTQEEIERAQAIMQELRNPFMEEIPSVLMEPMRKETK